MEVRYKSKKLKVGDKVVPTVPGSKVKTIKAEVDDERFQLSDGSIWLKKILKTYYVNGYSAKDRISSYFSARFLKFLFFGTFFSLQNLYYKL